MDINDFEARIPDEEISSSGTEVKWDSFSYEDKLIAKDRFSRFFMGIFVFCIASNIFAIAVEVGMILLFGIERAQEISQHYLYLWGMNVAAMYVFALPIFLLIVCPMRKVTRKKSKMTAKEFVGILFVAQAFMLIGNIAGTYIQEGIASITGIEPTNTTIDLIENSPWWIILIVAVIIGPIVEELMFRKLLMDKLGMYGDRLAIVISALAFGVFHGNITQLCYATAVGFILAYLYSKTSKISYCMLLHIILNFLGTIVPLPLIEPIEKYTELAEIAAAGGNYNEAEFLRLTLIVGAYSLFQYTMLAVGLYLFFKNRRRIFVSDRCEVFIPRSKRASVIIFNTGTILFILMVMGMMAMNIFSSPITTG